MANIKAHKELFLKSTIHTVAQNGIENTRTKDIANTTGFSEATLFRHFATKEELLKASFLYVDKKISQILLDDSYIKDPVRIPFEDAIYSIWIKIFNYLLDNPEETIFLIRYRYSSLYTDKVRSERMAHNGSFEKVYALFEQKYGESRHAYQGFLINYIFEVTLCMAEKLITGKIASNSEVRRSIWTAIMAALKVTFTDKD